ncbi:MAG: pyridoxamine 5'-phosphate oxidase family protein [Oscillospiraceae bacterium]|nr:pyridoxamine 5'-phosphate oxidase family protein [Oscillospiraceae bacterium]
MKEVYDFLKAADTYYLATMDGDQPRVRPFGTVDLFEDKIYILTGKSKNVSKQIQINPKVEITAFKDGNWIRITCELVRDERIAAKQHMLDAYPHLAFMYKVDDDYTEVLYMKNATAVFASMDMSQPPRTVTFG